MELQKDSIEERGRPSKIVPTSSDGLCLLSRSHYMCACGQLTLPRWRREQMRSVTGPHLRCQLFTPSRFMQFSLIALGLGGLWRYSSSWAAETSSSVAPYMWVWKPSSKLCEAWNMDALMLITFLQVTPHLCMHNKLIISPC